MLKCGYFGGQPIDILHVLRHHLLVIDIQSLVVQQREPLSIYRIIVPHSAVRGIYIFLYLVDLVNHSLEHYPLSLVAGSLAHILCNDNRLVGTDDLYLAVAALYGIHCRAIDLKLHIIIESMYLATPFENYTHSAAAAGHLYNVVRLLHPDIFASCR